MNDMFIVFKSPTFWAIFVPFIAGVITFYLTKAAERESEWRKEKLRLYLNFVESLSGITDFEQSKENDIKFAKACNDLHALASIEVLHALHDFQNNMSVSNKTSTIQDKQKSLDKLILKIRKDLKIKPKDSESEFQMLLWTSDKNN